jgi:hypothetical protein
VTVLTAADVLRRARDLLAERGWAPLAGGLSIYGAVALAVLGHAMGEGGPFEDEAHWRAAVDGPCRFLERVLARPCFAGRWAGIAHWEMDEGRRPADVFAVLEAAIAEAERSLQPQAVAA